MSDISRYFFDIHLFETESKNLDSQVTLVELQDRIRSLEKYIMQLEEEVGELQSLEIECDCGKKVGLTSPGQEKQMDQAKVEDVGKPERPDSGFNSAESAGFVKYRSESDDRKNKTFDDVVKLNNVHSASENREEERANLILKNALVGATPEPKDSARLISPTINKVSSEQNVDSRSSLTLSSSEETVIPKDTSVVGNKDDFLVLDDKSRILHETDTGSEISLPVPEKDGVLPQNCLSRSRSTAYFEHLKDENVEDLESDESLLESLKTEDYYASEEEDLMMSVEAEKVQMLYDEIKKTVSGSYHTLKLIVRLISVCSSLWSMVLSGNGLKF